MLRPRSRERHVFDPSAVHLPLLENPEIRRRDQTHPVDMPEQPLGTGSTFNRFASNVTVDSTHVGVGVKDLSGSITFETGFSATERFKACFSIHAGMTLEIRMATRRAENRDKETGGLSSSMIAANSALPLSVIDRRAACLLTAPDLFFQNSRAERHRQGAPTSFQS